MIYLYAERNAIENDMRSLIMAFYPGCEIERVYERQSKTDGMYIEILSQEENDTARLRMSIYENGVCRVTDEKSAPKDDAKEIKTVAKCMFYNMLSEITGRVLPWGTHTGIRPTKIVRTMLMNGVSPEDCIDYMENRLLTGHEKTMLSIAIAQKEMKLLNRLDYENGYSLYIGIPFCPTTCAYCSFTSYPLKRFADKVDIYLEALSKEIDYAAEAFKNKVLNTIYIGGGTPTTLSPAQLEYLLSKIENSFDLTSLLEWTVEAGRPDSITDEKLKTIKKHKVTRISINPQTMNDSTLQLIGRRHSVQDIKDAFALARSNGFDNINMDIIVGLPDESKDDVMHTLEEIKKLSPDNLTVHSLAIKRAARLNTHKEDFTGHTSCNSDEIMELTYNAAADMNMEPYYLYRQKNMTGNMENVGYAVNGKEGIYNILIMEEVQHILALGAGAVTKAVIGDRIERCENVKDIKTYLEKTEEMIDRKRKLFEGLL